MAIGQILSVAISGLRANAQKVNTAANNIVNQGSADYSATRVETVSQTTSANTGGGVVTRVIAEEAVDLTLEFTRIMEAEAAYGANAEVIRTVEEMERETVNILA